MPGLDFLHAMDGGLLPDRAHGAWDFPFDARPGAFAPGIRNRHSREELAGVGMLRVLENRLPGAEFHDLAL